VISQEEQVSLMDMLATWDDEASTTPPSMNEEVAVTSHPITLSKFRSQSTSPVYGAQGILHSEEARVNLGKAMEMTGFKDLRQKQEQQRDSMVVWAQKKRQGVMDGYSMRKLQLLPYFERQKDQLAKKQSAIIGRIEDKHVIDELDMREAHELETKNNTIALTHMEAYCKGQTASGEAHDRTITDRDLAELTKARRARDQMDAKHSAAISVLRGEQGRRISQRLLKQEEELAELEMRQLKELESLQRECDEMVRMWDEDTQKRRRKLERWWNIETEIWRKKVERDTHVHFSGVLPQIQWPCAASAEKDKRETLVKRHTIAVYPAPGMQLGVDRVPRSASPLAKHHRFSAAFTVRNGFVSKAQG
jgi:hypothetical protein